MSIFAIGLGWLAWEAQRPYYREFDSIAGCLLRRDLLVLDFAQHRDMFLEDYAFKVERRGGRQFHLTFLDNSAVRTCRDTIAGLRWSDTEVIDFAHPLIQAQLAQQPPRGTLDQYTTPGTAPALDTVADFLTHADWILELAEAEPSIVVAYDGQPQLLGSVLKLTESTVRQRS